MLALLVALTVCLQPGACRDPWEPNDTYYEASVFEVNQGGTWWAAIREDGDYYRLEDVTQGDVVTVWIADNDVPVRCYIAGERVIHGGMVPYVYYDCPPVEDMADGWSFYSPADDIRLVVWSDAPGTCGYYRFDVAVTAPWASVTWATFLPYIRR